MTQNAAPMAFLRVKLRAHIREFAVVVAVGHGQITVKIQVALIVIKNGGVVGRVIAHDAAKGLHDACGVIGQGHTAGKGAMVNNAVIAGNARNASHQRAVTVHRQCCIKGAVLYGSGVSHTANATHDAGLINGVVCQILADACTLGEFEMEITGVFDVAVGDHVEIRGRLAVCGGDSLADHTAENALRVIGQILQHEVFDRRAVDAAKETVAPVEVDGVFEIGLGNDLAVLDAVSTAVIVTAEGRHADVVQAVLMVLVRAVIADGGKRSAAKVDVADLLEVFAVKAPCAVIVVVVVYTEMIFLDLFIA